ncbi:MAG: P27 family phage terminase small subunit [Chitinispirillaceae bacterium]|nr:P27 family phage terminase small subunit [Chitinispirillaceae bacterium]
MGRNAKNIDWHEANGNRSHLSVEEKEYRRESEVKLGDKNFKIPIFVKERRLAFKKWKELMKLFKDNPLVTTADTRTIESYCLMCADLEDLRQLRKGLVIVDQTELFGGITVDNKKEFFAIEKAIQSKNAAIIQLEDRLMLNPISRVKNIPAPAPKQEDPAKSAGFGNV